MSYMTYYSIQISETVPTVEEVARKLAETVDETSHGDPQFDINSSVWHGVLIGEHDDTWYNHEENMRALSQIWPNVFFTLTGIGQDQDDHWVEYHTNGKIQRLERPQWEPDAFDPSKLE